MVQLASEHVSLEALRLAENMLDEERASVTEPLVEQLRLATNARFRRQMEFFISAGLPILLPAIQGGYTASEATIDLALGHLALFSDRRFSATYERTTRKAWAAGAAIAASEIVGHDPVGPVYIARARQSAGAVSAAQAMKGVDATTRERIAEKLLSGFAEQGSYRKVRADLRALARQWVNPSKPLARAREETVETVSRAEAIAQWEIHTAFGKGGLQTARAAALALGPDVIEKRWSDEPGACSLCVQNRLGGWLPVDAPFENGAVTNPQHLHCRCSTVYRQVVPE